MSGSVPSPDRAGERLELTRDQRETVSNCLVMARRCHADGKRNQQDSFRAVL